MRNIPTAKSLWLPALAVFAFLGVATAGAATKTWVPTTGGLWTTAANWSPAGAPASGDSVAINGDQSANITAVPAIILGDLTINGNCLFAAATTGNTLTVTNSFTVAASKTFTIGVSGSRIVFTLSGTGTVNGNLAYDAGTTVRNFTVSGTLIVNPSGRIYDPVMSPGSVFILSNGAALKIGSPGGISTVTTANSSVAINFGGSYSYGTGANYYYIGNASQVTGNGLPATVNSLTISNTGLAGNNTVLLSTNVAITANLTVSFGTLDLASFSANRTAAGGIFTVANGATLLVGGNNFPTTYSTFSLGATSTVNYNGAAAQNVSSKSYGNLIFSGSGSKSMVAGTSVSGNLSIAPAGTAIASVGAGLNLPVGSLTLGGVGTASGTWGSSSSTATFKNNTYFAATTGILTISSDTRFTPTITTLPTVTGTITYGQTLAALTLTGGSASVPGTFTFTSPSTAPVAGIFGASITFTPTDTTRYTTVVTTLNINVAPKTLTPTVALNNKVYDGTTSPANIASRSLTGIVGSDDVTLGTSGTVAAFSSRNVGSYTPTVSGLSLSGSTAGNYALSTTSVNPAASIQARSLTVTAHVDSKPYDGGTSSSASPDITSGSLQTGDSANFTQTYSGKDVGTGKTLIPAGTVSDSNGGNNYAMTFVNNVSGVISARSLTPTVTLNNKLYDGTTAPATIASRSLTGIVGSDDVTLGTSGTVAAFSSRNVGSYTPTVSGLSLSGSTAGNYTLSTTTVNPNASIQARSLTVTAQANSKLYDGDTSSATSPEITAGSLQSGDSANFTQTYSTRDVGTGKALIPVGAVSDGNSGNNYAVTFVGATNGIITARGLTVTGLTAVNKPYDGTTVATISTAGATLLGNVAGDSVTLDSTAAAGAFIDAQVGNGKTILVSGLSLTGPDTANYTLTQPTTTANITMASSVTTLGTTSNPLVEGSNVTFTASISAAATTTPTGTVQFFLNGTILATPVSLTSGVASLSTSQLPRGSNYITATYSGDDNFLASSNGLAQQVNPAPGLLTIQYHPDNTTTLTLQGVAAAQYLFQATSDLGSASWTVISTNTAGFDGLSIYHDLDAANHTARFYRAVTP